MAYTSFYYLFVLLPLVWAVWAVAPQKLRPAVLLAGSLVFYWLAARWYTFWLLLAAGVTFWLGNQLAQLDELQAELKPNLAVPARKAAKKRIAPLKKSLVTVGSCLLVGLLIWLKYLPFLGGILNILLKRLPFVQTVTVPAFVQPLGLSFFTLMAVSYLVDVSNGVAKPAQKYWQVLLYLCFWGHVVEGPFDRWNVISPALIEPPAVSYHDLTFGVQRIVWGLAKKMVIADRANALTVKVFEDYTQYSGKAVVVGTLVYTLQLYADFSGCMDIVIGSAQCFGIPLTENFRQPFFSTSVDEFWRRWHITLGAWLREYVFQPVIVGKPMIRFGKWCKEKLGNEAGRNLPVWLGLLLTWVLIGLWHGAGWIYLVYGLYYFALRLLSMIAEPLLVKLLPFLPEWRQNKVYMLLQILRTFVFVNIGMLIFNSVSVPAAVAMLRSIATPYTDTLLIGIDKFDSGVLVVGALLMLAVDFLHERGLHLREKIAACPLPLRWIVYIAGVLVILIFGAYGDNYDPAAFIYAQF